MFRYNRRFRRQRTFRKRSFNPASRLRRAYINIGSPASISKTTGTIEIESLLTTADDPDMTVVTNGTTIAQCAEDSNVVAIKGKLYIATATGDSSDSIDIAFWRDKKAQVADPTAGQLANLIFSGPSTEDSEEFRSNLMYYKKVFLTAQKDKVEIPISIRGRRLKGYLQQGSSIKMAVDNTTGVTVTFTFIGHIYYRNP